MPDSPTPPPLAVPESAREAIAALVAKYHQNEDQYRSSAYNEAQCRQEFIDPFLEALGWDVRNRAGNAEQYKDVVHEASLKVGEATKAPDYAFRVGGVRKFYVEAKKPSVRIHDEPTAAYQLRRYAWSAKLPLSILTDFDEFAVYDCRQRPNATDAPAVGRVKFLRFDEYLDEVEYLYSTFSPEAIRKGSFDRYVEDKRRHRGTAEVDAAFLAEIEGWRETLAKDIANHNKPLHLEPHQLNFAVQATIDRILFFRIAEDRGVEEYGRLRDLAGAGVGAERALPKASAIYAGLCRLYREADAKYNAGLFDFGRSGDTLCPNLVISDKALKPIIKGLYYPESPYEFSVLGADILGAVYEQFLGKVIRLTPSGMAKVEEKPEVKKAGGVYYTPTYIVDYIVEHTVREALDEAGTPGKAAKLRILDPACGSGSFLLGAYDCLLRWHLGYYTKHDPEKYARVARAARPERVTRTTPRARPPEPPFPPLVRLGDEWRLSSSERKRILQNNLYGVDIDPQAVEVTKLNLLLKCMEGDIWPGVARQMKLLHDRVLPNIDGNIKCGNSLIGPDYFSDRLEGTADLEEQRRIRPFDWKAEFADIMQAGGFDCVVGNPPYVFAREQMEAPEKAYYARCFRSVCDRANTYMLFMERAQALLRGSGRAGLIVPNSWLTIESAHVLRTLVVPYIDWLLDLPYPVFRGVGVEPVVYVSRGTPNGGVTQCARATSPADFACLGWLGVGHDEWAANDGKLFVPTGGDAGSVLATILGRSRRLGECFDVRTGLQAYETGKGKPPQTASDVAARIYDHDHKHDADTHPYIDGRNVARYAWTWERKWLRHGPWLSQPRDLGMFCRPRVLLREITGSPPHCLHASYVDGCCLNNKSILNVLSPNDSREELLFLLGQLNSTPMSLYYKARAVKSSRRLFPKVVIKDLRRFPVIPWEGAPPRPRTRLVLLVERMLDLHKRLPDAKTKGDRDLIKRQIRATDDEIDALVCEFYGLTDEEIAIVEGTARA